MSHRRAFLAGFAASVLCLATPVVAQEAMTETLHITGAFARATAPTARVGGAFLTIRSLAGADRLVGYTTPACNRPELHTHVDAGDGVMQMRRVEAIEVPAGGAVALAPGGLHLMMMDLTAPLVEGTTFPVTLEFEQAGAVAVEVPVVAMGAMGAMDGMDHAGHGADGPEGGQAAESGN